MEKANSILVTAARCLFILCLPLMFFTAVIGIAFNCKWLYEYGFEKYDVGQTTGLEDSELEKVADELIRYFNSSEEYTDLIVTKDGESFPLFNERETAHRKDVKALVWLDYRVFLATGSYVLLYATISLCWLSEECRRRLAKATVIGSGVTIFLILALGMMAALDFDRFFWQFHLIAFSNDLWLLDPSKDYLIMLFPQGFWYDATIFVALAAVGLATVAGGLGGGYLLHQRKQGTR